MKKPVSAGEDFRFIQPENWVWGQSDLGRGTNLRYGGMSPDRPAAHILYVEGLSEYAEKTFELAHDFNLLSCGFWVLDRYGQGLSGRFLKDRFKQHSLGFDRDAADIIRFTRNVIPKDAPVILLGHSTGGLIALMAAHGAPAGLFSGAAITSPLTGLHDPLMGGREQRFSRLPLPRILKEAYIPGGGPWKERNDPRSYLKENDFSSHPERMKVQDFWQKKNEALKTGSPTFGWVWHACRAMTDVRRPGYFENMDVPVLAFTAGKDVLVDNEPVARVIGGIKNHRIHHFPEGKHELLMETDDIRGRIVELTASLATKGLTP